MKVIYNFGKTKLRFSYPVVVIGIFDGCHRGHQALIKRAIQSAKKKKGKLIVFTFHPHPVHVLHPEIYLPYLTSLSYRLKLFEQMGVDVCVVQKFTKNFSRITPEKFIRYYLVNKLKVKEVFVGDDFRFGADREGNGVLFKELSEKHDFIFHAVHPIQAKMGKVSSTDIRKLIEEGKLKQASKYLGRPVSLLGKVGKGDRRGAKLGFPTANIYIKDEILPPRGVYAVYVKIDNRKYKAMANVGFCPSFHQIRSTMHVEVHIFNLKKNLYGKEILIEFIKKIRDEKIFVSEDGLINQLKKDKSKSQKVLNS